MFSHGVLYAYVGPFLFTLLPPLLLCGIVITSEEMRVRRHMHRFTITMPDGSKRVYAGGRGPRAEAYRQRMISEGCKCSPIKKVARHAA